MKNTETTNGKNRFKTLILATVSGVLGLALAATIFVVFPKTTKIVALEKTINSSTSTTQSAASGIKMPSADEIAVTQQSITPPASGSTGSSTGGGSNSGSTGGGSSSNSGSTHGGGSGSNGTDITGGNTSVTCPGAAACTAGYVAPSIQWGGIIACSPIDKSQGTWSVTYKWNAVGGNWNGYWNGGGNNGTVTTTLQVNPGEAGSYPILMGNYASIMITDMLGQGAKIDEVFSSSSPGTQMNTVCH